VRAEIPIYYEDDVVPSLINYCQSQGMERFFLVADQNTRAVLGKRVEERLRSGGIDVKTILLTGQEIAPDEHFIMQVLVQAGREERGYLAVGSGTITDIVRFASHRTKTFFLSLPTAPSVDGYTSGGAPLVIGGLKQTIQAEPPLAIFADLPTLCAAPRPMVAAGFGDMLGKFTALADWKLGHLLWDEPYSGEIAKRVWDALQNCVDAVGEIGTASAEGVRRLLDGLAESGLCMLDFGASPPASGSEHYISHYWEMKLLQEHRPAILHGAKVGVGCLMVSRLYERIRELTRDEAMARLRSTPMPDRERDLQLIRVAYGPIADKVIAEQAPFLDMSGAAHSRLQQKIMDHWADVQEIAASVAPPQRLAAWLSEVGGPVNTRALGLGDEEAATAVECSHFYKNRFTVMKLSRMLGFEPFAGSLT